MKDKPIIFNSEMVRAMLDGRKTQTRRVIKPKHICMPAWKWLDVCPYGKPGDRLWVRETWYCPKQYGGTYQREKLIYKADSTPNKRGWKPSIHMPRWASRITLLVKDVRVERVQDISPSDCECEGIVGTTHASPVNGLPYENYRYGEHEGGDPKEAFAMLWDSIDKKRGFGWSENPWVWVVEFERVK